MAPAFDVLKGPEAAPEPFRLSGPEPNVYGEAEIKFSCPPLIVKLDVFAAAAADDMRNRPPLRTVAPVYVLAPVPKVARPGPAFVNPPPPDIVPVRFSAPAVED